MWKSYVAWSRETVSRTSYSSMTREFELTAIIQNRPMLCDINLLYDAVAILSMMPDIVPDKSGLSTETRLPERKNDVLKTWWSLSDLYRCCVLHRRASVWVRKARVCIWSCCRRACVGVLLCALIGTKLLV